MWLRVIDGRLTLAELAGKSPLIAFPMLTPEAVAQGAVQGMNFTWSGQSCSSTSRLLVHESIADEVVTRIAEIVEARHIASPLDPSSEQGTMVTRAHHDNVKAKIAAADEAGAKLLTGGERPAHLSQGLFIAPVILDHVSPDSAIAREEVFGPVLSVIRFGDSDDQVAIANSVPYGLTGSVYTNDVRRAHRVARALECGYGWIASRVSVSSRSASAGPQVPGSYGCSSVASSRMGSTTCHAASTVASLVNRAGSPRMASPKRRS